MKRFFRNPQTIHQKRQGPLGAYIDDFAQLLSDQGYTRECARRRLRLVAEFSHFAPQNPLKEAHTATGGTFHSNGEILILKLAQFAQEK